MSIKGMGSVEMEQIENLRMGSVEMEQTDKVLNELFFMHSHVTADVNKMPDLRSFFPRLWWDETISTIVSRAIRLTSKDISGGKENIPIRARVDNPPFAPTGLTYMTLLDMYGGMSTSLCMGAAASDVDLVTTANADYMFEIDTFQTMHGLDGRQTSIGDAATFSCPHTKTDKKKPQSKTRVLY